MTVARFAYSVLAAALVMVAPSVAFACGELKFNVGRGLPFQGYLTPRPADVLILSSTSEAEVGDVSAGLKKAGHRVTVVADVAAMQDALQAQRYDVVIAALDSADTVTSNIARSAGAARVLPVVSRAARNSAALRERFEQFVLDGASLGQYLTTINKLLPSVR
jgi:hypothetical protein